MLGSINVEYYKMQSTFHKTVIICAFLCAVVVNAKKLMAEYTRVCVLMLRCTKGSGYLAVKRF